MPKYLVLPKIGMNMREGVISEWLIKPGDYVEKEQMVLRAETDKAIQDMFATESGRVYQLLAEPGDTVPCQGKIAVLLEEGEEPPADGGTSVAGTKELSTVEEGSETNGISAPMPVVPPAGTCSGRIRLSPLAKKLACEYGIPLESLKPARDGARIVKEDVLRAKEHLHSGPFPVVTAAEAEEFVPFTGKRKVISRRMKESVVDKPRVCHVLTVDCEELCKWRTELKKGGSVTYNELIMKACAVALKKYPELNILTVDGGYLRKTAVHIGVAVDHPKGLVVPVVKNVDSKGIYQLADEFAELTGKAKNERLTLDEMTGATFTISNLGMFEIESFDPIINVPECLILGIGAMREEPAAINGEICIRRRMKLCLSFDHAVIDGAPAARLLQEIKHLLEAPAMMLA